LAFCAIAALQLWRRMMLSLMREYAESVLRSE
jgi:hypothetical protein